MAYKRKRTSTNRPYSRKLKRRIWRATRRFGIGRALTNARSRNSFASFKRIRQIGTLTPTYGAGPTYGAYVFKLSDLNNYTEFTNLFDQYRIVGIAISFVPSATGADFASAVALPEVRTVVDYSDNTAPTSMNEMYEHSRCRWTRGNKIHKRYFKPSVLVSAYESAVATAYIPKWNQWLTTDDPATPHYCLKYAIDAPTTESMYYRVYATYYIQCKDVR